MTLENKIRTLLDTYFIIDGEVAIDAITGVVDVTGNVRGAPAMHQISKLPVKFGKIGKNFMFSDRSLQSLEGMPHTVGGSFNCARNNLTSLLGAPQFVGGSFWCKNNRLASLEGCPQHVPGTFDCSRNDLTNLVGGPLTVGTIYWCYDCDDLTSLEGAPQSVGEEFQLSYLPNLALLRILNYAQSHLIHAPDELMKIVNQHQGKGRRGAIPAAKEIMQAGEQLRQLQGLDHNPFEANARW